MNALDWFHSRLIGGDGTRYSWGQFIRLAVYCTNEQGSALYDATLGDPDLIEKMIKEAIAENSAKIVKPKAEKGEWSPPRRGYSPVVEALKDLTDNVIVMRGEINKTPKARILSILTKRPKFPADIVKEHLDKRARDNLNDRIAKARGRWSNRHGTSR